MCRDVPWHRLFGFRNGERRALREQSRRESEAFAIVDRVAHAFKHVEARKSPALGHLSANEVILRPPAIFDVAVLDLSRWDDPVGGVTIDDERQADLLQATKEAAAYLRNHAAARSS